VSIASDEDDPALLKIKRRVLALLRYFLQSEMIDTDQIINTQAFQASILSQFQEELEVACQKIEQVLDESTQAEDYEFIEDPEDNPLQALKERVAALIHEFTAMEADYEEPTEYEDEYEADVG